VTPTIRRASLAAALVLGLVATACGIPVDHSPRVIDRHDEPALLAGTSTTVGGKGDQTRVRLFLIRNNGSNNQQVQGVWVDVDNESSTEALAREALQRLIAYVPPTSASHQLTNAIPQTLRVLHTDLDGDVLNVDVSSFNVENQTQRLAFAELVFTATDLNGIDSVKFTINGNGAQVPLDKSTSTAGAAIDRRDYSQLGKG
jgi:spore germination protein GerM